MVNSNDNSKNILFTFLQSSELLWLRGQGGAQLVVGEESDAVVRVGHQVR